MMNRNVTRAMYRRDLSYWIAHLRRQAAEQTIQREESIRRHGIAHPRTIAVSRRLAETLDAGRHLRSVHRASGHEARGESLKILRSPAAPKSHA